VLERLERVLGRVGMSFADVARTWFYNDRILDWYDDFNRVRTAFFQQRDVFSGLVPASTGIGGGNLPGAALVAEALALRPLDAQASDCAVRKVVSPLQCPATNYRSSFSRAVEIRGKDWRKLLISGTASIDSDGKTARLGDVAGQIELTVDVIEAILGSCGMDWCDVSRAIAYVKNGASAALYEQVLTSRNIAPFPAIVTENDICRDDLLFELEIDAITAEKAVEASS